MTIKLHQQVEQGSDEWLAMRCGLLTASEIKHILTPSLKVANNDKSRSHVYEILAQRITNHVEPSYISDDMLRGMEHEAVAVEYYAENFSPVQQVGFITNNRWGYTIGYSPDGLVGDDGLIEIKSPRQKAHIKTLIEGKVPDEYMLQCQTGLLVSGREWIDFISFHAGLPMKPIRVFPDKTVHQAILGAVTEFEAQIKDHLTEYNKLIKRKGVVMTERIIEEEIVV